MKLLITTFVLLGLLAGPIVFAEDSKGASPTADAGSDGKKDDKKKEDKKNDDNKAEEEPDCD